VSLVPQTLLPYEFVPLLLIPRNAVEMIIFGVGSWIACAAYGRFIDQYELDILIQRVWPVMLLTVYLPMLYLVLRRPPILGIPQNSISWMLRRLNFNRAHVEGGVS
jgi:hypothetical protein